jgi:hypothetical protein
VLLFFYQHWLVLQKAQGMLPHKGLDFEAITPGDFPFTVEVPTTRDLDTAAGRARQ